MRNDFLLFIFLLFFAINLRAQDTLKSYQAIRVQTSPKIDGVLDEQAWSEAKVGKEFVMIRPIEKAVPTQKTEFRIVYDDFAIYVGCTMYDSAPDSILHELGLRDGKNLNGENGGYGDLNSDYFRFLIDPYNTRQDAFEFDVNAAGVQADSKFSDNTFDAVWESAVKRNELGWVAEIKIPYSAFRFPKKAIQEWAFQVARIIRRNREIDLWSYTPSEAYNGQLYWATLHGIENIKPPMRLAVFPFVSTYAESAPNYSNDSTYVFSNGLSYKVGADLKYGIDERFTIDATLLPDFGQVQSDKKIKTLGYQEVTYDENRPFFKEGVDLFNKGGLFYTRRIGKTPGGHDDVSSQLRSGETIQSNPEQVKLLNATKLSGRTDKGLGLGLFNAFTDNMYATLLDSTGKTRKVLTEPFTNFNVLVLDQQWKNGCSVSFINTNVSRSKNQNDADVAGGILALVNKKKTIGFDFSANQSHQLAKPDSNHNEMRDSRGFYYFIGVRKLSGKLRYGISRDASNPRYNPKDLGYYFTSSRESNHVYAEYFLFQPWKIFRNADISVSSNYTTEYKSKDRTDFVINTNAFVTLLDYNSFYCGGGFTPVRSNDYDPRLNGKFIHSFRYYFSYIGVSTDYRKKIALDITQNMSNFIDRFVTEGYGTDVGIRYRFSDKLTVNYKFSFAVDPFNPGYVDHLANGNYLYAGRKTHTYENRFSVRYLFRNDMSLNCSARHYWFNGFTRKFFSLDANGELIDLGDIHIVDPSGSYNFSYNYFNLDILYSWRFSGGSTLSVSYKNFFEPQTAKQSEFTSRDFNKNGDFVFRNPHVNTLSVKLLVYLDYQYLKRKKK